MERSLVIVAVLGIVAAVGLFFISAYLSLMALIVAGVVAMAIAISREARDLPDIQIALAEDARSIRLRNSGNAPALEVHASFVPLDLEVNLPSLAVEAIHEVPLPAQVAEVKAVVAFKNGKGQTFRRTALLSALHPEEDLLRPPFALFRWK